MKNQAVVLCCLLLLPHLGLCRNYARTLRKWKGGAENDITKKGLPKSLVIINNTVEIHW